MNDSAPNLARSMGDADQDTAFRVAIVGAGPGGFYTAEAMLKERPNVAVTIFEKLPVPHGLVRYGVAPDHLKLKQVVAVFDRIAQLPNVRFIGNVCIGEDLTVGELREHFHAVVLATGAECPRSLGIPGETLESCRSAGEFVAWYNGNPNYRHVKFDLTAETVVIVGLGNVTLDVARILCKSAEELHESDIASHALEALHYSKVRRVYIVGRGGPLDAKFTSKELREFETLENCSVRVDPEYLDDVPEDLADYSNDIRRNIALFKKFTQQAGNKPRHCEFKFRSAPVAFHGEDRVKSVELRSHNGPVTIPADLVFCSIGCFTTRMSDVPYYSSGGVHASVDGRIIVDGQAVEGLYTVGWSRRGANGVIGTNRVCGRSRADAVIDDMPRIKRCHIHAAGKLESRLSERKIQCTDYAGWQNVDRTEVDEGVAQGRPRVKITTIAGLLAAAERSDRKQSGGRK